jgi:diguanylate cyclase (GGDEF)-like protein
MTKPSDYTRKRPTIGILPGWAAAGEDKPDRYLISVVQGIQAAARARTCNLLLAWGMGRGVEPYEEVPAWPVVSPDTDFVPVGPWNTDGLIVFAPLLNESRSRYLQQVISEGHPVLFIGTGENGPSVQADNKLGVHQAIAHLVEHGHSRIAIIAGDPQDAGDSKDRLAAYLSATAINNLEADSRLIEYGNHDFDEAGLAIKRILASGVEFTAVLASDDNSAFGVMRALKEMGLRIPQDIAVMGFDDQPDGIAQIPSLSSVHVPLHEIGQKALELMVDQIEGRKTLSSHSLSTKLALRQSCGCLPDILLSSEGRSSISRDLTVSSQVSAERKSTIQEITEAMFVSLFEGSSKLDEDRKRRLCSNLLEGFSVSLNKKDASCFSQKLMEFLYEVETADEDIHLWQEPISIMWRDMKRLPVDWKEPEREQLAEELLHQARVAISDSARRQYYRYKYQLDSRNYLINELNARLSAINNKNKVIELLAEFLPQIGIRYSLVALFEPEGEDCVARSVLIGTSPDSMPESCRFPSRQFPPSGAFPAEQLLNLVLLPLVFQKESLGYVAFEATDLVPCSIITRHLAATFNSSQLHDQVVELSLTDALTGLRNRRYFDLSLKNEIDRSQRFVRGLAIIILDIDHFKNYNDTFGHLAGDEALKVVAQSLKDNRRKADVVARIGGEEFAVILPETDLAGALDVADKLRISVANHTVLQRPITVSLGVSELQDKASTFELLIEQADKALYEAKRSGRNRVCAFEYQR